MTTVDPTPARRIPDEGLFTIHFKNVGRGNATFDAQVPGINGTVMEDAMRKGASVLSSYISFHMPTAEAPGVISTGFHNIGSFTITPPTLKGDPDEPT